MPKDSQPAGSPRIATVPDMTVGDKPAGVVIPTRIVFQTGFIKSNARPEIDYIGMNLWAARELGVGFPFKGNTMVIVLGHDTIGIAKHEQEESRWMQQGLKYDEAHARAQMFSAPH